MLCKYVIRKVASAYLLFKTNDFIQNLTKTTNLRFHTQNVQKRVNKVKVFIIHDIICHDHACSIKKFVLERTNIFRGHDLAAQFTVLICFYTVLIWSNLKQIEI